MLPEMLNRNDFDECSGRELHENVHFKIGHTQFMINDLDYSLLVFEEMVKEHPESRHVKNILFQLGLACELKGHYEKAIGIYKKAALCEPVDQVNTRAMKKINILKNTQRKR